MTHQNFIYDIEVYPNVFTCSVVHHETDNRWLFEHSYRVNHIVEFFDFFRWLKSVPNARMVGFNNEGYDYPVIHYILNSFGMSITPSDIYNKSYSIIKTPFENRFDNVIWPSDRLIPQLDLFKIHHFDNHAKRTSLKMLEFQMKRDTIEDLPYTPGSILTWEQIDTLRHYNDKDVDDTRAFFVKSEPAIKLRDELSLKYNTDMTNFNDTKIGKQYFINRLEESSPGSCFMRVGGRRIPRQTPRDQIVISDIIFPYVRFERDEFNRILTWFNSQVITETKGAIDDLNTIVDGFQYDFGTGGIHGSVSSQYVESDEDNVIVDIDVTSYYPSLAIANRVYPEHLGETFCDIYTSVKEERLSHPKGTPENSMLKLSLNGVYGDSNNRYSPFYDPRYTMTITINGQLLLCMLAEQLIKIPDLNMIQINTDGLTVKLPRIWYDHLMKVCNWWENVTKLDLEYVSYSRMWIRDVNNYISEKTNGSLKLKGAYMHDGRGWHQNTSAMVIQKAVEAHLVHCEDVKNFIENHDDNFDFCLRTKLQRNSKLVWGKNDQSLQRITRYYVSNVGGELTKIMPPTPTQVLKNPDAPDRRMAIQKGWKCTPCNDMREFNRANVNYTYYIEKAFELIEPVKRRQT